MVCGFPYPADWMHLPVVMVDGYRLLVESIHAGKKHAETARRNAEEAHAASVKKRE